MRVALHVAVLQETVALYPVRAAKRLADKRWHNTLTHSQVKLHKMDYRWKKALLSRKGYEYKGIVDLVAITLNNKRPDELEIMLVQVKSGKGNRIDEKKKERLRIARRKLKITLAGAEIPETKVNIFNIPTR